MPACDNHISTGTCLPWHTGVLASRYFFPCAVQSSKPKTPIVNVLLDPPLRLIGLVRNVIGWLHGLYVADGAVVLAFQRFFRRSRRDIHDWSVRHSRFESHRGQLWHYHNRHCDSLGHSLHIPNAVLRSTYPSTLRGMVKWLSALRRAEW